MSSTLVYRSLFFAIHPTQAMHDAGHGGGGEEWEVYPDRRDFCSSTRRPSLALNTLAPLLTSSCTTSPLSPRTASWSHQHNPLSQGSSEQIPCPQPGLSSTHGTLEASRPKASETRGSAQQRPQWQQQLLSGKQQSISVHCEDSLIASDLRVWGSVVA